MTGMGPTGVKRTSQLLGLVAAPGFAGPGRVGLNAGCGPLRLRAPGRAAVMFMNQA